MAYMNAHVGFGEILAMPTRSGKNLKKPNTKVWLLLCYVGLLSTCGRAPLSPVNAHGGADNDTKDVSNASHASGESHSKTSAERALPMQGEEEKNATHMDESKGNQTETALQSQVDDTGHLGGPAVADEAVEKAPTEGQCTSGDAGTIFRSGLGNSGETESPASTNAALEEKGSLPTSMQPSNPFYKLLLSCGSKTLAQVEETKTCVQASLEEAKRDPLTESCVDCFMQSITCGATNCRAACFPDFCAESCLECNAKVCRPALLKCTGFRELPPVCVEKIITTPSKDEEDSSSHEGEGWTRIFADFGISVEE